MSSSSFGFGSSDLQILLESKKLEFYVDKLLHLSTRTRVFEARFCHQTQVSKTRDASFLNGFKTLLTNDILSQNYASLQITSLVLASFNMLKLIRPISPSSFLFHQILYPNLARILRTLTRYGGDLEISN